MEIEGKLIEDPEVIDIAKSSLITGGIKNPLEISNRQIVEEYFKIWLLYSANTAQKDWIKISPFLSSEDKLLVKIFEQKFQKKLVLTSYATLIGEYLLYNALLKHHRIFYWGVTKKSGYLKYMSRFVLKYLIFPLGLLQANTFLIYQVLKYQEADSFRKAGLFKKYYTDIFFYDENY